MIKIQTNQGGGNHALPNQQAVLRMVPHARTLRKAREQVKSMVVDRASPAKIRNYLARWCLWWNNAVPIWSREQLIMQFCCVARSVTLAAFAAGLLLPQLRKSRISPVSRHLDNVLTSLRMAG